MKIPTLLGLTLIITIAVLAVMYYLYSQDLQSKSHDDLSPQNIRFSNINDNSFTITWLSAQPTSGSISWGQTSQLGNYQPDSRDTTQGQNRFTHSVTISSLQENTTYYFKIRNGPFFYPSQALSLKTPPHTNLSTQTPIIGNLVTSQQSPNDGLVFLETSNASLISGYLGQNGNFLIPLANLRTADLSKNLDLTTTKSATILIQTGQDQTRVKLTIPTSKPLPPLILGQDIDLTK